MSNEKTSNLVGSPKLTRLPDGRTLDAKPSAERKSDEFERFESLAKKLATSPKPVDSKD